MSDQATLAQSIRYSIELTTRYLEGFDESSRTAQAPTLPNHPVWILGHCGYTMARVAKVFDAALIDADAYIEGARSNPDAFTIESISFWSAPSDDPSQYPTLARARDIFEQSGQRLAHAIESATAAQLNSEIPWGKANAPIGMRDLIVRLVFHNGTHAGQLTDLRRALKLERVLG